jgi:hypothetical protein
MGKIKGNIMCNLEDLNQVMFDQIIKIKNADESSREAIMEQTKAIVETAKTIIINSQLQLNIAKAVQNGDAAVSSLPGALIPSRFERQGNCKVISHIRK